MTLNVGIFLFNGVEELDFVGPLEVFAMAMQPEGKGKLYLIAEKRDLIRCAKGMRVMPDHVIDDHPPLDVLLVPGGLATREEVKNERSIAWIAKTAPSCQWVTSVCTGSMLLLAAGVAKGKRVTTHWMALDLLREMGGAEVVDGPRFVRDGNVVTSSGVSAGIDMSLWLVGQLFGVPHARATQRAIQYDPAPPYTADV
jgi:transcriptional regulator GlxA family with amidase domain